MLFDLELKRRIGMPSYLLLHDKLPEVSDTAYHFITLKNSVGENFKQGMVINGLFLLHVV